MSILIRKTFRKFKKEKLTLAAAVIFFIILLIGLGFVRNNYKKHTQSVDTVVLKNIDTSEWKIYKNTDFGFSLQYPPSWKLGTRGADNYSKMLKDPILGEDYKKYSEDYGGAEITLANPNGDVLILAYGYAELGYPLHVFKYSEILLAGQKIYKSYIDGCDLFVPAGYVRSEYDCRGKETKFYAVIYSDIIGKQLFDPKMYDWSTGSNSTRLSITSLHGKGATIWYNLKNPLQINDKSFIKTDNILDKIISTLKFSK